MEGFRLGLVDGWADVTRTLTGMTGKLPTIAGPAVDTAALAAVSFGGSTHVATTTATGSGLAPVIVNIDLTGTVGLDPERLGREVYSALKLLEQDVGPPLFLLTDGTFSYDRPTARRLVAAQARVADPHSLTWSLTRHRLCERASCRTKSRAPVRGCGAAGTAARSVTAGIGSGARRVDVAARSCVRGGRRAAEIARISTAADWAIVRGCRS
jgi:hypothetical protein